jgi:hypothetical protein
MTDLLPRARLLRGILEAAQSGLAALTLDARRAHQVARLTGDPTAGTWATTLTELIGAEVSAAQMVGCIDDGITGLETVGLIAAHPFATDEEFEAILFGRKA